MYLENIKYSIDYLLSIGKYMIYYHGVRYF